MTDDQERVASAFATVHRMLVDDLTGFFWNAFTALNLNGIGGDYVEFGSVGATTFRLAHDVVTRLGGARHLWAFDSFAGLPEARVALDVHPAFAPGVAQGGLDRFIAQCDEAGISPQDYTTVPGFYEETLPRMGADGPSDIAIAYIDCNMYSSTVSVLDFLAPRLKHGMILAFDDYFCWSASDVSGERAALDEFLTANPQWNLLRFKDPTWGAASFVVEKVDANSPRRRP